MFTKCLKLTKKSAVIFLIILGIVLAAAVILCSNPRSLFSSSELLNVSSLDGREKYLKAYGWEINPDSEESRTVLLPRDFEGALADYGEMQTEQGYDFVSYAGLECRQYTYIVTNYDSCTSTVYATLYIKSSRVIGGDIHSAAIDGFMHGIR